MVVPKGSQWRQGQQGPFYVHLYLAIIYSFSLQLMLFPSHGGFSFAVAIESLVSALVSQLVNIPPIPLPTTIDDYDTWTQVAKPMPPLQKYEVMEDTLQMVTAIRDTIKTDSDSGITVNGLIGRDNALRVIIVRDSMTQGQDGDYTWRYRIWQWFKEQGVAVDLVGPYTGTVQPDHPAAPAPPALYGQKQLPGKPKTSDCYAAAAVDKGLIQDVLSAYPADFMLLMLGFNDMEWFYSDAEGTLDSIYTLVSNARSVNPKLKFAIANVPQRSFIGGREDLPVSTNIFNALLRNAIAEWSTGNSPISLVKLLENYDCEPSGCPAGYDGLHPTAIEYQIVRAFALTLVEYFKIGSSVLSRLHL
ncbi:hypothetical protein BDV24DRAFT_146767 [Aspergillus arachidicola]|uniref:SGNH hydrolase-type esterase domain-containing protein n=1 Tax=Aspergillus arachidicola TaxID=656916 RepID=A0A5N6YUC2_9EURO|nr:hypothetical protein BDV24DRAFT_146767 [Aspergillus arachidicola]